MPTPEWVEACDRMGVMMMCETRQMSSNAEGMQQLDAMIKRYRNSPSIIIWSIGNEEWLLQDAMAEQGAKIAVHYFQNEKAANDTLAEVRKRGSDGFLVQADVTKPESITAMFGKVKSEFGTLDIFVSNARPEVPAFFQAPLDISLEQWDTAFDSQAKALLVGAREAISMMGDGGRIFAITYAEGSRTQGCT